MQAELESYKQENEKLRAQLQLEPGTELEASGEFPNLASKNDAIGEPGETIAFTQYAELQSQYQATFNDLEVAKAAVERYKAKRIKDMVRLRDWQDFAKRCERKLAKRSGLSTPEMSNEFQDLKRPAIESSDLNSSRGSSADFEVTVDHLRRPVSRSSPLVSLENVHNIQLGPRTPSKLGTTMMTNVESQNTPRTSISTTTTKPSTSPVYERVVGKLDDHGSSQTTESDGLPYDDGRDQDAPPHHPEFRVPSLTGNKRKHDLLHSDREGSMAAPIPIKSEPLSSPRVEAIIAGLRRTETLDLDETGEHIDTPRKRQRRLDLLRQKSSFSFPPPAADPYAPFSREPYGRREERGQDLPIPAMEPAVSNIDFSAARAADVASHTTHKALHPWGHQNQNAFGDGGEQQSALRKKKPKWSSADFQSVAEDGETFSTKKPHPRYDSAMANNLLEDLLDNPALPDRVLITPVTARKSTALNTGTPNLQRVKGTDTWVTPATKQLPTPVTGASKQITAKRPLPWTSKSSTSRSPASGRKQPQTPAVESRRPAVITKMPPSKQTNSRRSPVKAQTPLRDIPMKQLKPEDFVLNPRAHGELDLTSMDPVRDREARRHLHACTDPNCMQCGQQLRMLAETMPITVGSTLFASSDDGFTDDERLLKFHLGVHFDPKRIAHMPHGVRKEIILEAKMKIVADRHSRHKLRPNARAKSPPGFWDVEMPTTQEFEARHAEVEDRARELVKERYREATRPDGRWIFRDE